jgi:GntR family transcriptional regulator
MSDAPKYRTLANELREDIRSGRLPVGGRLPTKAALMSKHGVALGTVDRALNILRDEGLIKSEQGAGTWIIRVPDDEPDLPGQIAEIREQVEEVRAEVRDEALRSQVAAIEAALRNVYIRQGWDYPGDAKPQQRRKAAVK